MADNGPIIADMSPDAYIGQNYRPYRYIDRALKFTSTNDRIAVPQPKLEIDSRKIKVAVT